MPPRPFSLRSPLVLLLGLLAACDGSSDSEKPGDTAGDAAETDGGGSGTDSGMSGGSDGGSSDGGGSGTGLTDNDGDGWATEQGDLDDSDPTVHPGALEVLGDGIDQDCDGEIDEVHLDRVAHLDSCAEARDVRVAANSTTFFASVLCTQARVSMPDEEGNPADAPTDYWDSALAFGWTVAQPGGQPTRFYDWSRNLSDPNAELLTSQALVATDDALYGAVALRTPSNERASLRLAGFHFGDERRFGVNFSGRDASRMGNISLALGPDAVVHAVACDEESGAPRSLLGTATTLGDSSYDAGGVVETLGSTDACAVYYRPDGTGVIVGADNGTYEWTSFTEPTTLLAEDLSSASLGDVRPEAFRVATGGGATMLLMRDTTSASLVVEEVGSDPATAPRHVRMNASAVFSGAIAPDGATLALAWVDGAGDPQIEVGPASGGGATTLSPDMPAGTGTIQSFEVQFSADGRILWYAATDGVSLYQGAVGL